MDKAMVGVTMNFEIAEAEPDRRVEKFDFVVSGQRIGSVEKVKSVRGGNRYHVAIDLGSWHDLPSHRCELLQGFGDTVEKAVEDAFARGGEKVQRYLTMIEELKVLLASGNGELDG